ncbi:hypothetical protein [Chitiniphilus shinanonensis]|uniref:hypothetical protein n=1 Tax=Chitiniphilus shinanonensis TaxID=553088 RepID=UPI00302ADD3E
MSLYSLVVEFEGDTCISQISAATPQHATLMWLKNTIEEKAVFSGKDVPKEAFDVFVDEDSVIGIDGTKNIWCFTSLVEGELILIHIIKTAD